MKKIFGLLLFAIIISSCSMSIYAVKKGNLKILQKETYQVRYQADIAAGLIAKVAYTSANGTIKLKNVTGNWHETVQLNKGTVVKFKVDAKGVRAAGECKIFVDDKIVSQHILTNKKLYFNIGFILP